ncbi:MAG: right-handed parallel beta-helix repeat-containing protein, partial [Mariniphaga sp.]
MKRILLYTFIFLSCIKMSATEYHVAKTGSDNNPGTSEKPFLTIQAAANIAQPGDTITVHKGIYREWVKPVRGGTSDNRRIVFRAAENEKAEIKGSEIIKGWENLTGTIWRVALPNSFFNDYNPYRDLIRGDWFNPLGKVHHTGEIYLNGKSLWEASLLEDVLHPKKQKDKFDAEGSLLTWFCESDEENTYLYANFQGADPNAGLVEINVRKSCFYPENTGINYITVKGFHMSQAATQWAPPTAEQIGLIGTNWSKGWIIENNTISDSKCSGITLGKHGDEYDNTSENSAEGYVETIHRAIKRGWSKENIGSHIVRNNTIYNCEQTGICGSLGAIFSTIENNNIYNIWVKRQFTGAEMGGIKIHAAIDMLIINNRLANCGRGLWLDWMAQGTRVYGNLLYNNTTDDLFVEVNHGPFVIENNLFLSELSLRDWSEGGAYIHNLFAGTIEVRPQDRLTPYHLPHSTKLAGLKETLCGDNRFYNNIFAGNYPDKQGRKSGLKLYDNSHFPTFANGNIYLNHAQPLNGEKNYLQLEQH